MRLTTDTHDRDVAGMTYVYPVVSRRARGVSVGVNLNPNNACNFRCVYCQVPGLVFGNAPDIDLELLERELHAMLSALVRGDYMERHVPEDSRVLRDIAFSGNGEPTSATCLPEAVEVVERALDTFDLRGSCNVVLITNGSLAHKPHVARGLERLAHLDGEAWFKLDSATEAGLAALNNYRGGLDRLRRNLELTARACRTWVQTMALSVRGEGPSEEEQRAYTDLLAELVERGVPLRGVLLYGLARASHQPEAEELRALEAEWMQAYQRRIEAGTGLEVRLSL